MDGRLASQGGRASEREGEAGQVSLGSAAAAGRVRQKKKAERERSTPPSTIPQYPP